MKSTFSRTFFPAAIILLATLLLVGTSFYALVRNYLTERTIDSLKNNSKTIAGAAAAYYHNGAIKDTDFLVNLSVASSVSGADTIICDTSGQLLLCSDSPLGCEHQGLVIQDKAYLKQILSQEYVVNTGKINGLYSDSRYVVATCVRETVTQRTVGFVITSYPMTEINSVMDKLTDIFIFVSVLVVLLAVISMTIYARKLSHPLGDMAKVANAFGHGNLEARVVIDSRSAQEVQELALAFNNMAVSLEKSEYQRKEFVANVSHELKTPMTTIGGYIDGILDGTIPPEKHRQSMKIVSDETKRLNRLVRSMLDISRLQDSGGIPEDQKSRFDITELAGQVLFTFEQKITQKALDVQVTMPEYSVFTRANADYITQVVYNLLDNAVKFCPQEGQLSFSIKVGKDKIYICISNSGKTIPQEELPFLFDRFHKLDKSRSENRDGYGLGLYIVKTIVCAHNEDISVTSAEGKTAFTFTLPLET